MNKISEKAVWDELTPSEDENTSQTSFGQPAQPQMMFCYKCSQVIPANSAFCPWCQTELYVTCPKCSNKYSSQYPACNQCGTNREQYIEEQRRLKARQLEEQQKKKLEAQRIREEARRIKAEEDARKFEQERIMREREEEERKKRNLAEKRKREREELEKIRIKKENNWIKTTNEYKEVYLFLEELGSKYRSHNSKVYLWIFMPILLFFIAGIPFLEDYPPVILTIATVWIIYMFYGLFKWLIPLGEKYNVKRYRGITLSIKNPVSLKMIDNITKHTFSPNDVLSELVVQEYRNCGGEINIPNSQVIQPECKTDVQVPNKHHKYRCGHCGFSSTFIEIPSSCPICSAPSFVIEKIKD